jgi:hypothetical protein
MASTHALGKHPILVLFVVEAVPGRTEVFEALGSIELEGAGVVDPGGEP